MVSRETFLNFIVLCVLGWFVGSFVGWTVHAFGEWQCTQSMRLYSDVSALAALTRDPKYLAGQYEARIQMDKLCQ
jgi:hypothetical protein